MEAADDISYCIADIEDAVEKDILDVEKLCALLIEESESILREFGLNVYDQTVFNNHRKSTKKI